MRRFGLLFMLLAVMSLATGCVTQVPDGNNGGDDGGPQDMNTNGADMNSNGEDVNTNGPGMDDGGEDVDANLAKFEDPDSDFSTTEVRDVDGELMQFDTSTNELVWLADGTRIANWRVEGTSLIFGNSPFRARFGTEDGERRVYFTEVSPPTICDLVVNNGFLSVFSTNVQVPQE
ncbi:MAG: hypothetical protein R3E58_17230 [Phycisphaerae bacterium]|nr:hypothetical protein [Phycisphaerales bacterium]